MNAIETFEVGGLTVKIYPDEDTMNPREWDSLGKFAFQHRRYDLPWEVDDDLKGLNLRELYDELVNRGAVVILKVYGYDHGIFTISAESFYGRAQHAEWDSGVIGLACVFRDDLLKDHNRCRLSDKLITLATLNLKAEIEEYNQFLTGEVYGYAICQSEDDGILDSLESCWGFYGLDYCKEEARAVADSVARIMFDPAI